MYTIYDSDLQKLTTGSAGIESAKYSLYGMVALVAVPVLGMILSSIGLSMEIITPIMIISAIAIIITTIILTVTMHPKHKAEMENKWKQSSFFRSKSLGIEHVDFQRYSSYKLRTYGGCDILHFLDETGKKQSQTLMGDSKPHHFNTDVVVVKYPGYKPGTWKYKAYPAEMFENRTSIPFE